MKSKHDKEQFVLIVDRLYKRSKVGHFDIDVITKHDKELARAVQPWIKTSNTLRKLIKLKIKGRPSDELLVTYNWSNGTNHNNDVFVPGSEQLVIASKFTNIAHNLWHQIDGEIRRINSERGEK